MYSIGNLTFDSTEAVTSDIFVRLVGLIGPWKETVLRAAPRRIVDRIHTVWNLYARPDQLPPQGDWLIWLLLGGRGSGKTRAGAEWVRERVANGARRVALVAPSFNEAREVMIEGESGLLNIGPPEDRPRFMSSRRRLEWPNGAVGHIFSSEDPDGLRGPQFDTAWGDEFCAWTYPKETLSNLRLGLRLRSKVGDPKLTITTTPRPIKALRELMQSTGIVTSRAATRDNHANLAPAFVSAMEDAYGGTRLGRQELGGEIMSDHPGALWTRVMIERALKSPRAFLREDYESVILAIDPPITSGVASDACGLIVAGRKRGKYGKPGPVIILHDGSVQGRSPEGWARKAASLYKKYNVDYAVAESNQGGDMVRTVLRQGGGNMVVRLVHAAKSKTARAMPIALLYEQGRVEHQGCFPDLEDELCQLGTDHMDGSPDRADALVWAVTELSLRNRTGPRIWVLGP